MKSGIYLIQCLVNGKCYIGQSINIENRLKSHLYNLKKGNHFNVKLQRAFNKYGDINFSFLTIFKCSKEELDIWENVYIKLFDSNNFGYNVELGGNLNKVISEETRLKMSLAKKGKTTKRKGTKFSNELKLKLSLAHKGLPSPNKGKKTNKPAWNSGKIGVQISPKRIKIDVFDTILNVHLGEFESIQHFLKEIDYKSKNFIKISENETKIGRYLLKKII